MMNLKSLVRNKKGFTIIEVVLVLAIAGLIFLMVFLAWPALSRGQRDTQRKDDMGRFITALNSYQSNNSGKVPQSGEWGKFINNYLQNNGDKFSDPNSDDNVPYGVQEDDVASGSNSIEFDSKTIHLYRKATCDGENAVSSKGSGDRKIAIRYKLEGAGTYCGSN